MDDRGTRNLRTSRIQEIGYSSRNETLESHPEMDCGRYHLRNGPTPCGSCGKGFGSHQAGDYSSGSRIARSGRPRGWGQEDFGRGGDVVSIMHNEDRIHRSGSYRPSTCDPRASKRNVLTNWEIHGNAEKMCPLPGAFASTTAGVQATEDLDSIGRVQWFRPRWLSAYTQVYIWLCCDGRLQSTEVDLPWSSGSGFELRRGRILRSGNFSIWSSWRASNSSWVECQVGYHFVVRRNSRSSHEFSKRTWTC